MSNSISQAVKATIFFRGGAFSDVLRGSAGNNALYGEAGNDKWHDRD
ncbi:MAG: hypothetical protein KME16_16005 [Scytolyngbya sp. HA4215-MV1]|nr:hypothetical protein [Scytolyngbya sp. HA4215-MV1]